MHQADSADLAFCRAMLPQVSRTFAACIMLLPPRLAQEVLVAYLLCRIADTIEDCPDLPVSEKADMLRDFAVSVSEDQPMSALCQRFSLRANPTADEQLVIEGQRVLAVWQSFSAPVRAAIRPWVVEMCQGMAEAVLQTRAPGQMQALESMAQLDRYCYFVAGTVGHLLTDLFPLHCHRLSPAHYHRMKALASSFGLGLQLTNIIKDVADDAHRGCSFVPRELCAAYGLSPEELLLPQARPAAEQVLRVLISKAQRHLDEALEYCLLIPRNAYRMRLFCLTPLFFALRTLSQAARDPRLLDPQHKVKISRKEVHRLIRGCALRSPSNRLLRSYYRICSD